MQAVINLLKQGDPLNRKKWPLDTMVEVGNILEGPSRNIESEIAHFKLQNISNTAPEAEKYIRTLCDDTFKKYIWKLEKGSWLTLNDLE